MPELPGAQVRPADYVRDMRIERVVPLLSPDALLEQLPLSGEQADVVIYDGHCSFCRGQVERVNRWDTPGRLAYLSLHDPEVARRYPDLDHDALDLAR